MSNERPIVLSPSFLRKFVGGFCHFFFKFVFVGKVFSKDVCHGFDAAVKGGFGVGGFELIGWNGGSLWWWICGASFRFAIHHGYR